MNQWKSIADIRREYGNLSLKETKLLNCPIEQFKQWFSEVLSSEKSDPTAMVLSTTDAMGHPDSRVVLLKELNDLGYFVFYSNYQSSKAHQLDSMPFAALNFYWPQMARQVRVRGSVEKVSETVSDEYFSTRPKLSQLSAILSLQSSEIESREVLDKQLETLIRDYEDKPIARPKHWGGFQVIPQEIEFWQGRDNRLHDRIQYQKQGEHWVIKRLAP